jgi:hypothetical protein
MTDRVLDVEILYAALCAVEDAHPDMWLEMAEDDNEVSYAAEYIAEAYASVVPFTGKYGRFAKEDAKVG